MDVKHEDSDFSLRKYKTLQLRFPIPIHSYVFVCDVMCFPPSLTLLWCKTEQPLSFTLQLKSEAD